MLRIEILKRYWFSFEEIIEIQEWINDIESWNIVDSKIVFDNLYKKLDFNNLVNVKA